MADAKYHPLGDNEIKMLLGGQTVVRLYKDLVNFNTIDEVIAPYEIVCSYLKQNRTLVIGFVLRE